MQCLLFMSILPFICLQIKPDNANKSPSRRLLYGDASHSSTLPLTPTGERGGGDLRRGIGLGVRPVSPALVVDDDVEEEDEDCEVDTERVHVGSSTGGCALEFRNLIDPLNLQQQAKVPAHKKAHTLDLVITREEDLHKVRITHQ